MIKSRIIIPAAITLAAITLAAILTSVIISSIEMTPSKTTAFTLPAKSDYARELAAINLAQQINLEKARTEAAYSELQALYDTIDGIYDASASKASDASRTALAVERNKAMTALLLTNLTRSEVEALTVESQAQVTVVNNEVVEWEKAEAERKAAEEAAAQAEAQRKAAASSSANSSNKGSASGVVWTTWVANSGDQAAVDACTGGLTYWGSYYGLGYYPIHRHCGGSTILDLQVGQQIKITGGELDGVWTVQAAKVVQKGDNVSVMQGMPGSIVLQTCYNNTTDMRLVSLSR